MGEPAVNFFIIQLLQSMIFVIVCSSVCSFFQITVVICVKMAECTIKTSAFFTPLGSRDVLVVSHQTLWCHSGSITLSGNSE